MNNSDNLASAISFPVPSTENPPVLDERVRALTIERIRKLFKKYDATVIAHYYTDHDTQLLADETGGFIGDSLAMADFGYRSNASTLIVAGVRFMGETAKILNPEKKVLMPTLEATCSLDLGCPADKFSKFCDQYPDRTVVVYANTSAAVKARADWVVTSSNALAIIDYLDARGEKILWAPDRYLGAYIQKETQADMIMWQGSCVVHEEFKAEGIAQLKREYPQAAILVHPESPAQVIEMADVVGSTSQLLKASKALTNDTFIVATDRGIFYKMQQASPGKKFLEAPTAGHGATCRSCAHCPWMAMNHLERLEQCLLQHDNEIKIDANIIEKARIPLQKMLDFKRGICDL